MVSAMQCVCMSVPEQSTPSPGERLAVHMKSGYRISVPSELSLLFLYVIRIIQGISISSYSFSDLIKIKSEGTKALC